MSFAPLTPPCVPFGTRRFNHNECKDLYASDICTLSVPSHRKAEKPKFRIKYTLTARLFSVFTLSFNFFSRYSVLVPSNLSAARMLFAKRIISSAYRITLKQTRQYPNPFFSLIFPPMRPPRVSVITFTSYICCIYALKFGQYWTSFCLGNSSVSKRLIYSFCSSDRVLASAFLQTPPHDGRPCLWLTVLLPSL